MENKSCDYNLLFVCNESGDCPYWKEWKKTGYGRHSTFCQYAEELSDFHGQTLCHNKEAQLNALLEKKTICDEDRLLMEDLVDKTTEDLQDQLESAWDDLEGMDE